MNKKSSVRQQLNLEPIGTLTVSAGERGPAAAEFIAVTGSVAEERRFEPSVPVAGRGQAARSQIFRRRPRRHRIIRRNKAADRLVKRATDQPSRILPPPPPLVGDRPARWGGWHAGYDFRYHRS